MTSQKTSLQPLLRFGDKTLHHYWGGGEMGFGKNKTRSTKSFEKRKINNFSEVLHLITLLYIAYLLNLANCDESKTKIRTCCG